MSKKTRTKTRGRSRRDSRGAMSGRNALRLRSVVVFGRRHRLILILRLHEPAVIGILSGKTTFDQGRHINRNQQPHEQCPENFQNFPQSAHHKATLATRVVNIPTSNSFRKHSCAPPTTIITRRPGSPGNFSPSAAIPTSPRPVHSPFFSPRLTDQRKRQL